MCLGRLGTFGANGGILLNEIVVLRCGEDLHQHGLALANGGFGQSLFYQSINEVVDVQLLDALERGFTKVVLQLLQRESIIPVCGHFYLVFIVRIPSIGPLCKGDVLAFILLLTFVVPVLPNHLLDLGFCGGGKRLDNPLPVFVVTDHELAVPVTAGELPV